MAIVTIDVINLGTFTDASTSEISNFIENTIIYQQTFGNAGNPLHGRLQDIDFDDRDNNGQISTNAMTTSDTTDGEGGVSNWRR